MAVDYNLVILGGSLVARRAAIRAAEWHARVALVEPPRSAADWEREQLQLEYLQASSSRAADAGMPQAPATDGLAARLDQARDFAAWQFEQSSPAVLAARGIDVVAGAGRFVHQPTLGVQVGDRVLRGHHYLIAVAAVPQMPSTVPRTLAHLQQLRQHQLQSLAVWGSSARSVVLAQALQRLGLSVVLATPAARLLPQEDSAIADLIQAQLEAEGVRIVTTATLTVTKPQQPDPQRASALAPDTAAVALGRVEIQSGALTLKADAAIAPEDYRPRLAELNLPDSVTVTPRGISVRSCLRAHPRIYACGAAVRADCSTDVAIAEAAVAVDNALSFPYRRVQDKTIPRAIATDPLVVRVGLTEAQARKTHRDITVLQQSLAPLRRAQLHGAPVGLCRVVVSKRGIILGAYAVGPAAGEWMGVLGQAIAQRRPLQSLGIAWPSPAYGEVVSNLSHQWRLQRRLWLTDKAELLLNWRRDWTR